MISLNNSNKEKPLVSVFSNILLSALVLLQSLAFQLSQPDTILCIGDNGHVMLEQEGIDSHSDHPSDPFLLDQLAENDFHEDDCLDISLEQHLEIAVFKHKKVEKFEICDQSYKFEIIYAQYSFIQNQIDNRNNIYPPELDALKGIVLLI